MAVHDGGALQPVPHTIVATWPEGTFVENIAITPAGDIFLSVHSAREILRVRDGEATSFAGLGTAVTGLAFDAGGTLWASGGVPGSAPGLIWRIEPDGTVTHWLSLPEAMFLNGITPLPDGRMLVADSILGMLFVVDTRQQAYGMWTASPRLRPTAGSAFPGANGLKLHGGYVYVTNTGAMTVLRAPLNSGEPIPPLTVVAENLLGDDIAFDIAGALYIATHVENSLVRLTPDGGRTTLAGPEQGMVGSTACAFHGTSLYVTTEGGVAVPYQGGLQPAKLVRLDLGVTGAPIT